MFLHLTTCISLHQKSTEKGEKSSAATCTCRHLLEPLVMLLTALSSTLLPPHCHWLQCGSAPITDPRARGRGNPGRHGSCWLPHMQLSLATVTPPVEQQRRHQLVAIASIIFKIIMSRLQHCSCLLPTMILTRQKLQCLVSLVLRKILSQVKWQAMQSTHAYLEYGQRMVNNMQVQESKGVELGRSNAIKAR